MTRNNYGYAEHIITDKSKCKDGNILAKVDTIGIFPIFDILKNVWIIQPPPKYSPLTYS